MKIRPLIKRPIVLVGMIGSGKSTIGKKLAKKLNLQFYDSDKVIEEREGINVMDVFEFKGEQYFKAQEENIIREILNYGTIVLATGGSSFMNENIRNLVHAKTTSIWLAADLETLYLRVSRRSSRPELRNRDPKEALEEMMKERYPIYSQADIKIQSDESDKHFVIDTIVAKLEKHFKEDTLG